MSQDSPTDGVSKPRRVLGDLTNRPIKRGFPMISADSGTKSGDGYGKNVGSENGDPKFAQQVPLGVEDLVTEKCETKLGADCNPEPLSSPKGTQESEFSVTCSVVDESSNDMSDSATLSMSNDFGEKSSDSGANATSVLQLGDALMDNCSSIVSLSKCSGLCNNESCGGGEKCQCEKAGETSDAAQSIHLYEGLVTVVRGDDEKDFGVGNLVPNKHGSTEWPMLSRSQGFSKPHEFEKLERCTTLKGDRGADCDDLLQGCTCSFCLKAAHILADLQYQDMKGRITALKRSQREASILVERSSKGKEIETKGRSHPNKAPRLDYDLTSHWRSLFLHMEDMLAHESNHLQESFIRQKDLRDNCKMELGTGGVPSTKQ